MRITKTQHNRKKKVFRREQVKKISVHNTHHTQKVNSNNNKVTLGNMVFVMTAEIDALLLIFGN